MIRESTHKIAEVPIIVHWNFMVEFALHFQCLDCIPILLDLKSLKFATYLISLLQDLKDYIDHFLLLLVILKRQLWLALFFKRSVQEVKLTIQMFKVLCSHHHLSSNFVMNQLILTFLEVLYQLFIQSTSKVHKDLSNSIKWVKH